MELFGHRVPSFGNDEREAKSSEGRQRPVDQRNNDAAEDQQNQKRK
jgi:hypothetical protein